MREFRAAADRSDPHQGFATYQFAATELGLIGHQRDVEFIAFQRRVEVDAAGAPQLDFHVRVGAREALEHFRQNIGGVEIRGSQRDVAGNIGCRETAACLVVDPQHGTGELQQHFAVMGEAELAAVVFEQSAAGEVLQPADLMGDRRLGAADLSAGRGKSPGIDDRDEGPQQRDVEILVQ